jgi:hypothetical protein
VLMNMRAESALPEEPFLETARFSHVRTPSIHGICTAQTHQLLAKIVAKSRRARLHEVRLLLLRYCPPKRQGHHPITESIAESTSSVCVCAKMGAAVCPNPYRATLVGMIRLHPPYTTPLGLPPSFRVTRNGTPERRAPNRPR